MGNRPNDQGSRYRPTDIHRLMVYVATLILLVAMTEYMFRPGDDVLVYIIATILGFLFGKATNGIGGGAPRNGEEDRGR